MSASILFVCGSLNQTTMMHKIAQALPEHHCHFTPFYAEGTLGKMVKKGLLEHTILAGSHFQATTDYLFSRNLPVDPAGCRRQYDLAVTCTDLIVQSNLRKKRLILVQEGITEPEAFSYLMVKNLGFPRFLANTAATGLSDAYDRFCVASPGYRDLFIHKGVNPSKLVVTGIPNFDDAGKYLNNDFPYRNYVLVATSSIRETGKADDRIGFLRQVKKMAAGRKVLFRLHPNENMERAEREISRVLPDALVFKTGDTNHMIANCDMLITQVSSVVFTGIALGKEVYSYHNLEELTKLAPLQNDGTSALRIADECRKLLWSSLDEVRKTAPVRQPAWMPSWLTSGFE